MTDIFEGSPKQYAASLGIGAGGRGRPTAEQVKAIADFRSKGGKFRSEVEAAAKPKRVAREPRVNEVKKHAEASPFSDDDRAGVDLEALRKWAADNGVPVAARGRVSADVRNAYLAAVPPEDRPEKRVDFYGPTPADVNPPGTLYYYKGGDGKEHRTTAGNGRAACMRTGYSVVACAHAGAHRILVAGEREPVDIARRD